MREIQCVDNKCEDSKEGRCVGEPASSVGKRYNEHRAFTTEQRVVRHSTIMKRHNGNHTNFKVNILVTYRTNPTKRQISVSENIHVRDPQINRKDEWAMIGFPRQTKGRSNSLSFFHVQPTATLH